MIRNIKNTFSVPELHMVGDGFRMRNFIPGFPELSFETMDPFLVMDFSDKHIFSPTSRQLGVGSHPHKGFETVTIAYHGRVEHRDSTGGGGVIKEGDVQWMTAASGIIHSEFHEKEWAKEGGLFQMVQLWVNLPAEYKKENPRYQTIENERMGKVALKNGGVIEVISGNYHEVKGAAKTHTPIHLMNAKMKKDEVATFDFPEGYTTAALVVEGKVNINGTSIAPETFVLFEGEGETFELKADEDAVILILSGEPIKEPIFAYGPFVMNTREEVIQAYEDFNNGKFGTLAD